jgi:hypothetical protein
MKPISRSQLNGGFRPDSGPSRGGSCRRTIRPCETFIAPPADYRPRPEGDLQVRSDERLESDRKRSSAEASVAPERVRRGAGCYIF